jgi:hypothetical protein
MPPANRNLLHRPVITACSRLCGNGQCPFPAMLDGVSSNPLSFGMTVLAPTASSELVASQNFGRLKSAIAKQVTPKRAMLRGRASSLTVVLVAHSTRSAITKVAHKVGVNTSAFVSAPQCGYRPRRSAECRCPANYPATGSQSFRRPGFRHAKSG